MNDQLSAEELAAMSAAMSAPKTETQVETPETQVEETKQEATEVVVENTQTQENTQAATTEKVEVTETKVESTPPPATKTLEEYIAEKSGGKFKSWDEIESQINAPKVEFANEEIQKLNELAAKGIKLDEEFFEIQRKDYENSEDASFILKDALRYRDNMKGLSETTLNVQLNKKYNYDEWKDKDQEDMTPEDLANEEIMLRDAEEAQGWLINFKKERTLPTQVDPKKIEANQQQARLAQENWEKYVDAELHSKVTNLTTPIEVENGEVKEKFVYEISESDRKEISNTMKLMTSDINVLFNRFMYKDEQGNTQINHRKVFEMLVKEKSYDTAVKNAYKDGKAVGAKNFVEKDLKNIDFKAQEGMTNKGTPQTEAEAIAAAMKAQNVKF